MKLFLLLLLCHVSSPVKHSMKVFFTASSAVPNFPEVVAVMLVNDVETGYCDSKIKTAIPKQVWMEKLRDGDPTFWRWYTGECTVQQQVFKEEFHSLNKRLNKTGGVHILQRLLSCELDEETGEINGLNQYGYDGEDFLVFQLETHTWIAPKPQSVIFKHMWDGDRTRNDFFANFINRVCIDCLLKQLEYGRSFLLRTALPSVSLLQKTPSSPVSCHATGFYPDRAMMFWRKDGEELDEDVDRGEILPNHDGTFQMRADLNISSVSPEDWRRYDCVFQFSGVKEDIITKLDQAEIRTNRAEKSSDVTLPITAAVAALAVMLMSATGFIVYKKKKDKCPPCPPDNSSELSEKLNPQT
ncbi:major histocompatibility complex class I-related gene protein isoform X14 [Lates calcarifer]|uniref:Major histocompatibility complex class I-related gene protein isoform X14 n=1 Tax=Lates calcarifer TaxID=8187 RepID=A0AAJ7PSR5_LATCA|nr:major histocompatibility complex class I-related gene protein isoform X14 [Lates calcarifer]